MSWIEGAVRLNSYEVNFNLTHVQQTWVNKFSRNAKWEWPSCSYLYMTWNIWSFEVFFINILKFFICKSFHRNPSVVLCQGFGGTMFSAAVHGFFAGGRRIERYVNGIPASTLMGTFNDMHSFAHNSPQMGFSWIIPILSDKEWDGRTEVYFLTSVIHVGILITWWWCPLAILVWNSLKFVSGVKD
jgi:hypothetical protein